VPSWPQLISKEVVEMLENCQTSGLLDLLQVAVAYAVSGQLLVVVWGSFVPNEPAYDVN
jgi:hypothetical protein